MRATTTLVARLQENVLSQSAKNQVALVHSADSKERLRACVLPIAKWTEALTQSAIRAAVIAPVMVLWVVVLMGPEIAPQLKEITVAQFIGFPWIRQCMVTVFLTIWMALFYLRMPTKR